MQKQELPDDVDSGEFRARAEDDTKPARGNGKRAATSRKAKVVDPILPEKKRARRRLIGAVALVLAAVIGLPMLLDSEPKPVSNDINIQIPSKDKPSALVEHNNAMPVASTPVVASKNKPVIADPVEEIITPAIKVSPVVAEKTNPSVVKPDSRPETKLDTKLEAKPEQKIQIPRTEPASAKASAKASVPNIKDEPASKVQNKAETADEAARALAILEGKTPVKTPVAKSDKTDKSDKVASGFVVQAAALATQEKVNELQGKLNAANIKSYTQKVVTVSGQIIRIRVGPFESKDEAEKMRAKLEKMGLSPKLVPN